MAVHNRILLVSSDTRVLQTRKLMLGAYFDVYPAARVHEAKRLLSERSFHLIILCYSLTPDDRKAILAAAQERSPAARVLTLSLRHETTQSGSSPSQLSADEGPMVLLRKSAEILGFEFRSRGRMIPAVHPKPRVESPSERVA